MKIDTNTLVFFTSDNGPWLIFDQQGGSAGLLRGGKGSTWEGGMREPTLAWWPGQIEGGRISREVASTMDIFATLHHLVDIPLPSDRTLDSHDLTPILRGTGASSREALFYYRGYKLMAVRVGPWKLHYMTQDAYGQPQPVKPETPILFHLGEDPSERFDVAAKHPEVVERLQEVTARHREQMHFAPSQLEKRLQPEANGSP